VITLPPGVDLDTVADLSRLACVVQVIQGEHDPLLLVESLAGRATPDRADPSSPPPSAPTQRPRPVPLTGWRSVAVWSVQGGSGKSTLAAALALEAASRQLPTLLVGLGAPDSLPLSLSLKPDPNLGHWVQNPSLAGLQESVQRVHGVDLLAGFPTLLGLSAYLPNALSGESSLSALASLAAQAGYATLVLDVSAAELAGAALAAANTLLLVSLPTLPGLLATVEAVRLAQETLAPRHRIAPERVHLLLNRVRPTTFSPDQMVKNGRSLSPHFPSLVTSLADDPGLDECLNQQQPAYYHVDSLRQAATRLGDTLFGVKGSTTAHPPAKEGKVYQFGPLRVRV
jgi:MinD-like ATPase involved in chromosome partitioning or flagellar assembly